MVLVRIQRLVGRTGYGDSISAGPDGQGRDAHAQGRGCEEELHLAGDVAGRQARVECCKYAAPDQPSGTSRAPIARG